MPQYTQVMSRHKRTPWLPTFRVSRRPPMPILLLQKYGTKMSTSNTIASKKHIIPTNGHRESTSQSLSTQLNPHQPKSRPV